MFEKNNAFAGYSVDDLDKALDFYANTLGVPVAKDDMGILRLTIANGSDLIIYPKGDAHQAATFTVLNFPVDDIEATVDELTKRGVSFEKYDSPEIKTNEKGIAGGEGQPGPRIAWFKDPAGNILSVLQD
jgi:catechol 2,3-dioxygenase-like lactoylglutathione lyase family enzyme